MISCSSVKRIFTTASLSSKERGKEMTTDYPEIREHIAALRAVLSAYPNAEILAAVKTRSADEINFAIRECGITLLGENRVQELLAHYDAIDRSAQLHFIGTLQKNKVKYIIDKVSMIESVDSEELAREIDKRAGASGLIMPILIEVNIGEEASKSGVLPADLNPLCRALRRYPAISPKGLMTIAPRCKSDPERERYFSRMQELLQTVFMPVFPEVKTPLLSMGMSDSYAAALRCGANIIRIGEGIFGKRNSPVHNIPREPKI